MLKVEQIHEWRGQEVRDRDGEKIGKLDEVFYDSVSGEAQFISVKSGLLGRKSNLVTLADASVGRDHVRVAHSASEVEAVEVGEDGGVLGPDALRAAAESYGVQFGPDSRFESATSLSERRAQAAQAAKHADELEREASLRDEAATASRGRAQDAAQASENAGRERDEAQKSAASARAEADEAARDVAAHPLES